MTLAFLKQAGFSGAFPCVYELFAELVFDKMSSFRRH
jgi:hypothetical protein